MRDKQTLLIDQAVSVPNSQTGEYGDDIRFIRRYKRVYSAPPAVNQADGIVARLVGRCGQAATSLPATKRSARLRANSAASAR